MYTFSNFLDFGIRLQNQTCFSVCLFLCPSQVHGEFEKCECEKHCIQVESRVAEQLEF